MPSDTIKLGDLTAIIGDNDAKGETHFRDIEVKWVEERDFSKLSARSPYHGCMRARG